MRGSRVFSPSANSLFIRVWFVLCFRFKQTVKAERSRVSHIAVGTDKKVNAAVKLYILSDCVCL